MAKPELCIGGPLDGDWVTVLHGNKLITLRDKTAEDDDEQPASDRRVVYRRQIFRFGRASAWFWVPDDSDDAETLKIITDRFPNGAFPERPTPSSDAGGGEDL